MAHPLKKQSIASFIAGTGQVKHVDDLPTDAQVLFGLITLITNIKYRIKYGQSLEWTGGRGYSKSMQNEDFPEQIPSVDGGLESVAQRRIPVEA
ncbi:MAG: hypothetical protein ACREGG_04585 [Candidatus Saccharimonadales bacterium]